MTRGHVESATYRYGCNGRPRPVVGDTYTTQAGWSETFFDGHGQPMRVPVWKLTPVVFGPERIACQYDKKATDAACTGCPHAQENEP